jgi:hypothetical protein
VSSKKVNRQKDSFNCTITYTHTLSLSLSLSLSLFPLFIDKELVKVKVGERKQKSYIAKEN